MKSFEWKSGGSGLISNLSLFASLSPFDVTKVRQGARAGKDKKRDLLSVAEGHLKDYFQYNENTTD